MSTSLPILVNNLSDRVYNNKCIDCKSYLDYMSIKDYQQSCTQLILRCFKCKMNYRKDFNKELINRFSSTFQLGKI